MLKLDEYTRITTPRSDVLFKKGYLSRPKKNEITPLAQTSDMSNGSTAVSASYSDETASFYRMQSISPEKYSVKASPPTYSGDEYDQELPLMYSSGFYDGNGYFYVNRMCKLIKRIDVSFFILYFSYDLLAFVQNRYDQFNGPTILMPYGSPPLIDSMETKESPYSTQSSLSSHIPIEEDSVSSLEKNAIASEDVSRFECWNVYWSISLKV